MTAKMNQQLSAAVGGCVLIISTLTIIGLGMVIVYQAVTRSDTLVKYLSEQLRDTVTVRADAIA